MRTKQSWIEVFWIILYSAVISLFLYAFAHNAYGFKIERLLTNIAFFILLSCALLLCKKAMCGNRLLVISTTVLTIIPNIIVLSYLIMDHSIMRSTDFWVVFDTNPAEAAGFFAGVPAKVFVWSAVYVILCFISGYKALKKSKGRTIIFQIAITAFLAFVLLLQPFRTQVAAVDFYKSFYKFQREKYQVAQFFKNRENLVIDSEDIIPDDECKTFVFVIGESQNREHMSLYGYPRETTPLLQSLDSSLVTYSDVVSPAIQTLPCMKAILTFSNYEQPEMYIQEASIVEIVRDAGYKTFWIDNQGAERGVGAIDMYTPTSYRSIAQMCSVYEDNPAILLDSMVVSRYKKCLQDPARKKFIFLHLMGNHFEYAKRYESSYHHFTDEPVKSKVQSRLTYKDIEIINHYDNATLYHDYIVYSIIRELQDINGITGLIYISDHGEEVFDTEYSYTRSFERILPAMCDIPFIMWRNDKHRESIPLVIDSTRPYCTDDIIHSLMNFTGIRYHLYDSSRSIFSEDFNAKERIVQGQKYESILSK